MLIEKAKKLNQESHLSHFRAIAIAFESIAETEAAPVLYDILSRAGMKGHAIVSYEDARRQVTKRTNETSIRNDALKEILTARALYRCGDTGGAGLAVLQAYASSRQGHYSRHASEIVLEG